MQSEETVTSKLVLRILKFHWNIQNFELICAKPRARCIGVGEESQNVTFIDENTVTSNEPPTPDIGTGFRNGRSPWFYNEELTAVVDYREEHYCLLDIDLIQSSDFTVGEDDFKTTWFAYMKKKRAAHTEHLSFFLHMISGPRDTVIKHQFSIQDITGQTVYQHNPSTMITLNPEDSTGVEDFISVFRLYENKDTFLTGDTLRICVDIQIIRDVINFSNTRNESDMDTESTTDSESPLPSFYQNFWKSKEFADMYAKCGETLIPAHKFILSLRSTFLSQIIQNKSESIGITPTEWTASEVGDSSVPVPQPSNVIEFDSIEVMTLNSVLEFIYTSRIAELDWENFEVVSEVLRAAQLFEMEDLLKYSFKTLCTLQLSLKSISSLVVFVYLFKAPENLQKKIYNFCITNMELLKHLPEHKRMTHDYPRAFLPLLYKI